MRSFFFVVAAVVLAPLPLPAAALWPLAETGA
jgi:hypothetical protein